jgi:hypothetical protein
MSLQRDSLPDPVSYFEGQGLSLDGSGVWRTARCEFHGGSDSMRINIQSGGWICMAGCGAKGGDVLAYHRAAHSLDFVSSAIELGAWVDDERPYSQNTRPSKIPAKELLAFAAQDLTLCVLFVSDMRRGELKDSDYEKFLEAVTRIIFVSEVANG